MKFQHMDTKEQLDERLILSCCATVTVQDVLRYIDEDLVHEFLRDMRHNTLGRPSLHVSCEHACHVLKNAVYMAGANAAAKIQFGDTWLEEVK